MTLPVSGSISLSQVNTELGNSSSASISLAQSSVRTLFEVASGQIKMSDGYGKQNAIVLTVNSTVSNYNVFTSAGSPSTPKNVILNITSTGVIGGVGATALTIGQFPTGSVITVNNSGSIIGFGGSAGTSTGGGNGGDAIKADYPNQTVVINNSATAFIYGGGGGGGKGGTGGTGGSGSYSGLVHLGGAYYCSDDGSCNTAYGGGAYCVSSYGVGTCSRYVGGDDPWFYYSGTQCTDCVRSQTISTSGGSGGAGGNGGVGQGYSQSQASGSTGSSGAAGGTNAGTGGTGGTGGSGGVYGANGSTGSTGSTGSNGNVSNGSAGASGYTGGTSGRYLLKGANTVTLNNSGTVAGGLA